MAHPHSRLKQFELQLADERRRQAHRRQREAAGYQEPEPLRRRQAVNTLGPQEDVIERRRHRNRVSVSNTSTTGTRNILAENVFLLLLLAGSIYGIYRLCIHILNL